MNTANNNDSSGPSKNGLLKGTLLALIVAIAVTFVVVLPAEYGVDPTGIGAKLGLVKLNEPAAAPVVDNAANQARTLTGAFPGIPADFDFYEPEVLGDPFSRTQTAAFRSDTLNIELDVGEQVEYKAIMKQGDALIYHWKLESGVVYTDFHADPGESATGYPDRYFVRYAESENGESSGSLIAPFDGNHGWYWLNIEEEPIKITLKVSGYYEKIEELFRSYQ